MTLERAALATAGKLTVSQWWYLEHEGEVRLDVLAVACDALGLRLIDVLTQAEEAAKAAD